jgi:hypothetical protein
MRNSYSAPLLLLMLCLASACSPRDFLTRRLAGDLVAGSSTFNAPQDFWLRTGVVSNKDFVSPEYLVMQRHGWITGSNTACPAEVSPPPCWDVVLTPNGVNVFRGLLPNDTSLSQYFNVPAARRELIQITGISKGDQTAQVDFRWKWVPLNAVGSALYNEGMQYASTVTFRHYDDGWRIVENTPARNEQGLDDALKNAEPAQ